MAAEVDERYSHFYYANNSTGTYTRQSEAVGTAAVYEKFSKDGFNDKTDIIGDSQPTDIFGFYNDEDSGTLRYVGRASSGDGSISRDAEDQDYLVTNTQDSGGTYTANNTATPICYAAGALIRTVAGEIAIEALSIGDRVVTVSGEARSIRWIGHRAMACRDRKDAMPVRIAAHALGEGKPARELFVSTPTPSPSMSSAKCRFRPYA